MKNIIEPLNDGAIIHFFRGGKPHSKIRLGPNHVHAIIRRRDGSIEDLGISTNLLTNTGRDLWAAAFGNATNISGGNSTGSTATGLTGMTGLATDGCKGWRIWVPITAVTTPPVYGNIGTNSTTAVTVDQWWTAADGVGTTPAAASAWMATPTCLPRFMGLTTDSGAASAADSVLATEILVGGGTGCGRAKATYAHTATTATYTMQVIYSVTGTVTAIHKMGLFTSQMIAATAANSGIMVFETVLNQDATVGNGDTLTVTDTITLSG